MKVYTSDDAERRAWEPYEGFCTRNDLDPLSVEARNAYASELKMTNMGENIRAARLRLIDLVRERRRATR